MFACNIDSQAHFSNMRAQDLSSNLPMRGFGQIVECTDSVALPPADPGMMLAFDLPTWFNPTSLTTGALTAGLIGMVGAVWGCRLHQRRTRERRIAGRRRGRPIVVQICQANAARTPLPDAAVIDRSMNGLGLIAVEAIPPGTHLDIRPRGAPANAPWARTEVVSAVQEATGWRVGCVFLILPPWSTLRSFE